MSLLRVLLIAGRQPPPVTVSQPIRVVLCYKLEAEQQQQLECNGSRNGGRAQRDHGATGALEAICVLRKRFSPHFLAIDAVYDIPHLCRNMKEAQRKEARSKENVGSSE
jgi:hypothetical protein